MAKQLERIAEGFTAEIFRWNEGQVLKLYRPSFAAVARRECRIMRTLAEQGLAIPRVIQLLEVDGRTGYVMQEVRGASFRDLLETDPAAGQRCATVLGRLHAHVHGCQVNGDCLDAIGSRVAHRIRQGANLLGELHKPVCDVLGGIPEGLALCHNDFHFGNILQDAAGLWSIDWNGAGLGDAHADVAKSVVLMTYAPAGICLGPRGHEHRSELVEAYLHAYRTEHELDPSLLRTWQIVRAAELICLRVPFADSLAKLIGRLL